MIGAVGDGGFGTRPRQEPATTGVDSGPPRQVPGASGVAHIVVDDEGGDRTVVVPGANGRFTGLVPGDGHPVSDADPLPLQWEIPLGAILAGAAYAP